MEKKIFNESITRLKSAEAIAFISAATDPADGLSPLQTQAWWEEQVEDALSQEPENLPFACPAVFFQFGETEYEKGNTRSQDANGTLTLHLVQLKTGNHGIDGDETKAGFDLLLDYADVLIDLLSGFKLPCSAMPVMTKVKRDHSNTPLMHDEITFSWTAVRKRASVPEIP